MLLAVIARIELIISTDDHHQTGASFPYNDEFVITVVTLKLDCHKQQTRRWWRLPNAIIKQIGHNGIILCWSGRADGELV